jgi:hypothetical protein
MTIATIREQLARPSIAKSPKRSIPLARKGIKLTKDDHLGGFYFRFVLARMLLKRNAPGDIKRAIGLMEEGAPRLSLREHARPWADTHLFLGVAYQLRDSGSKEENLRKSLEEYTKALRFFTRAAYPKVWATIKYALGASYAIYGSSGGGKAVNVGKAIENYMDALKVFKSAAHREQHDEITRALKELRQERTALQAIQRTEPETACA